MHDGGSGLSDLPSARIEKTYSIYLDLVRFSAAMVVFLSHACTPGIAEAILPNLTQRGIDAVTVFFVLSGFVISHTAETKDRTLPGYIISRLARLWSVGIPALVLAAVLGHFGTLISPEFYRQHVIADNYSGSEFLSQLISNYPALRFAFGVLFVNEAWTLRIIPFHNAPYWSLGYEFCYYLLFAACFYLKSSIRVVTAVLVALLFGPKILLLLPVWLMGVALHRWRPTVPTILGWPCVVGSIVVYLLANHFGGPGRSSWFDQFLPFRPSWSGHFAWQYFLGILVSINLLGFRSLRNADWIVGLERPIRTLAAQTLSIYLFHFPILYFLAVTLPIQWHPAFRGIVILSITIISIHVLSRFTEARKSQWHAALVAAVAVLYTCDSANRPRDRGY
jgi:peptidoglycan/LPS O-acetylase OafA/YrhL